MAEDQKHTRTFPKKAYGSIPEVDGFIKQGTPSTNWRQAPKDERWWVDGNSFPNLTKARLYVMDILGIPTHDPIATHFEFVPARGYQRQSYAVPQTKGEVHMQIQNNPKVLDAASQRNDAQAEVDTLRKVNTDHMTDAKRNAHNQELKQAQARLSYRKTRYSQILTQAQEENTRAAEKATTANKEHISATPPAELPSVDRISSPMHMPRFEVQVGTMMTVKCHDIAAVEEVMLMVQRNTK